MAKLLEARAVRADENRRRAAEQKAEEQARRAREEAVARARHLDSIAGREEELWRQVETAISSKQAKEYDRAVSLLNDLRELGGRSGDTETVVARIRQLRQQHSSKRSLIQKLNKAGFFR